MKSLVLHRIFILFTLILALSLALSGCGSKEQETPAAVPTQVEVVPVAQKTTASQPQPTTPPTAPPPTTAPVVKLGETIQNEEGGYAFQPVPEFKNEAFGGMITLSPAGADPDIGPLISLIGGTTLEDTTNEDLYAQLKSGGTMEVGPAMPVNVAGIPGLAADLGGTTNGKPLRGKIIMVMVTPRQQFLFLGGAPVDGWDELEPLFNAVLRTVTFFEPVAAVLTSGLEPGWTVYSNTSWARDLVVHGGVAYVATPGGMVAYNLSSGYAMKYNPMQGMSHISAGAITVCELPALRVVVGTLTGLSFYDPSTGLWEKNGIPDEWNKVKTSSISRLYCDQANNQLLVGYSGVGVLDLATGAWKQYTTKEGLSWNGVADLAVAGKDIWVASGYNGIARIRDGQVTVYNEAGGMPSERAGAIAAGADGTVWVGTSKGLVKFSQGAWKLYDRSTTPGLFGEVSELEIAADGTVWAASTPIGVGRLCQFDPKTEKCLVAYEDAGGQPVYSLDLDEAGRPVFGTGVAVNILDGSAARRFAPEGEYLASNFVDSFASTPGGLLWIGTDGGLQLIDPANPDVAWMTFKANRDDANSPGGNWASSIAISPDDVAWFAIINGSASRYESGTWTSFKDLYSYDAVAVDSQGRAWFGDDSKGITILDRSGQVVKTLTAADGLPSAGVRTLLADGERMWIGAPDGLAVYENEKVRVVIGKDDPRLTYHNISSLALDANGKLLVGATGGLYRLDGDDLAVLYEMKNIDWFTSLISVAQDHSGRIWIASTAGIIYSDDEASWTRLTTADGLPTNNINTVYVDAYGALWVGGGSSFDGGGLLQIVP